ncbi:MAG: hydrolase 1, exosortase A system-associated [Azonexus sp.]|jgi:exosortase A-associated hydrolase 1|uniref:hydrolase 1, exosortase A system-associated n=1 Tax=Azonexus sp. TaxID=1872668 RepID=UPI002833A1A5|nr:hydrolase 1, exosortase A system-associated [Azonexus sp.]MDR0775298.1 hydrolase 1, exosortase A system-associated [Azonexus sp.]
MSYSEQAIVFPCAGETLLGIVAVPDAPATVGVLIVVGGPQYRAGSHRQFLLLARALAAAGYPALRFDYRGMGDSSGELRDFTAVDADIAAALAAFRQHCPQLERIVLWGLCDAATAALLYWDGSRDAALGGLALLNPWARSEATLARTHIKHYYVQRLLQGEFWRKLLGGRLGIARAVRDLAANWLRARHAGAAETSAAAEPFQTRMMRALADFPGPSLLLLSGDDYTAKEFLEACRADAVATRALAKPDLTRLDVPAADHTFSSRALRRTVEAATLDWLRRELPS